MITLTNFKGGVGSTTLLLLLAHFLASLGKKVYLIDCSEDQYLTALHQRSVLLEEDLPFEFFSCQPEQVNLITGRLNTNKDEFILIDLPKLSLNKAIFSLYQKLSIIIIPFQYGMLGLSPSIRFALTASKVLAGCKLIYLPNILPEHSQEQIPEQQNVLRSLAPLTAPLYYQQGLSHLNSLHIPPIWLVNCSASLEVLCRHYIFSTP